LARNLIFLGAGASKVFGIKTLQQMTDDLFVKLRKKNYGRLVDRIIKSLNNFNISPDFESIYTILSVLTNPVQAIKSENPFIAYILNKPQNIETYPKLLDLLHDFRDYIYEECTIQRDVLQSKIATYDNLFYILKKDPSEDNRNFTKDIANKDKAPVSIDRTIVTTNYDMFVELYHNVKSIRYADGFRFDNNRYVGNLDVRTYSEGNDLNRWLIKLHGAIWQFKQGDQIIKTTVDPKSPHCPIPIKVDEEMMIYPTGEKRILQNPYFTFYQIFKVQEWKKLIVIGYSFRDDPVNIAILENLQKTDSNLIILDPNPEKAISNLADSSNNYRISLSKFNERIIRVQGGLEEEETIDRLEQAVLSKNWQDYKNKVQSMENSKKAWSEHVAQARRQAESP